MRALFTAVLFAALTVLSSACGQKTDPTDGGTEEQDAGCDPAAAGNLKSGTFLDAGWSVEWEQLCGRPPDPLRPGLSVNAFCTLAERCAQQECACAGSDKTYAARACRDGTCRDPGSACNWTLSAEPRLCQ